MQANDTGSAAMSRKFKKPWYGETTYGGNTLPLPPPPTSGSNAALPTSTILSGVAYDLNVRITTEPAVVVIHGLRRRLLRVSTMTSSVEETSCQTPMEVTEQRRRRDALPSSYGGDRAESSRTESTAPQGRGILVKSQQDALHGKRMQHGRHFPTYRIYT